MNIVMFNKNNKSLEFVGEPDPNDYAGILFMYNNGVWYISDRRSSTQKSWRRVDISFVPKHHRAHVLIMG